MIQNNIYRIYALYFGFIEVCYNLNIIYHLHIFYNFSMDGHFFKPPSMQLPTNPGVLAPPSVSAAAKPPIRNYGPFVAQHMRRDEKRLGSDLTIHDKKTHWGREVREFVVFFLGGLVLEMLCDLGDVLGVAPHF